MWENLTTLGAPLPNPQDVRAVLGVGPFDLAPGGTANARFAVVAGASEAEIIANAAEAQSAVAVAVEGSVPPGELALAPVYPNPTASHATVRLDLRTAQEARLAVFDVLGRRVAVLHDGPLGAGAHRLRLDAAALPAGVYVVRATAGTERITRTLVVAR